MADNFKNKIMRKVYAIWFVKRVAPVVFLEIPLFTFIAFKETASEFFVAKIIENLATSFNGGVSSILDFSYSALVNAPIIPVAIIMFALFALGYSAYRLTRNFSEVKLVKSY